MAFGGFDPESRSRRGAPLAEINMTPMIDVMLVLLVIFILSAPLFSRTIGLQLPKESVPATAGSKTARIALNLDRQGHLFWNATPVDDAQLDAHLAEAEKQSPQPEIAFRADEQIPYARVAHVMAAVRRAGLTHFGFVVDH